MTNLGLRSLNRFLLGLQLSLWVRKLISKKVHFFLLRYIGLLYWWLWSKLWFLRNWLYQMGWEELVRIGSLHHLWRRDLGHCWLDGLDWHLGWIEDLALRHESCWKILTRLRIWLWDIGISWLLVHRGCLRNVSLHWDAWVKLLLRNYWWLNLLLILRLFGML